MPRPAPAPPSADAPAEMTPYERYVALFPDGMKGDLIDGNAVIDMSTSVLHERLFKFLLILLEGYAEARGLGEVFGSRTTMRVDDENGYEPDVLFIRADRLGILDVKDARAPVDLAVEIVSPSSGRRDRETKFEGYERVGVPEYWLVDPVRREAAFYRLDGEPYQAGGVYRAAPLSGGVFESGAVGGFRFDPQVLFQDPLPSAFALLRSLLEAEEPGTE
ncbi:Uma2 family endonuclease [Rubrivirga litoralis]|uniref:Uma2 family endonuclease n=1 Tax=Rubrivirga litoralis TaxID=3075598 RepID=A0ABU3BN41_9BACT|nr:Uma2 family endonuclease [Rubrivirga sp. F394]MDT0630693.1 Uma2 family endonuclease [Rubrivirga sp. F394]